MLRIAFDSGVIAASNPVTDLTVEAQMPGDMYWCLVHNNSQLCLELQDSQGRPFGRITPYTQVAVRMKPKSVQLIWHELYRVAPRADVVKPQVLFELSPDKNGDSLLLSTSGSSPLQPAANMASVTAPGANATIVGTGQVGTGAGWPPGLYRVTAATAYGAVGDIRDNMKLVLANVATITQLMVNPGVNSTPAIRSIEFEIPAGTAPQAFQVQSIAAGAAGCVYVATLDVVPLEVYD